MNETQSPSPVPLLVPRQGAKRGPITDGEQTLVTQFLADQPDHSLTPEQFKALCALVARRPDTVERMLERARQMLENDADFYVKTHRQAVERASHGHERGDLAAAMKGAQWAMENIGRGKSRIVDAKKESSGGGGTKIMIGVKVGGDAPVVTTEVE